MKLVDVNEFYAERGGGVRSYVDAKLAAGAALGHEVVVIAPGPRDAEEARAGGRVLWVRSPPMPLDPRYHLLLRERAVHALLARERPDVIEGSSPWTGGVFCARYRDPGRALKSFVFHQDPVAVYGHTLLDRALGPARVDALCGGYFSYLRALSAHYDLTLTGGEWLAERLRRRGLRAPEAVSFGVDKQAFSPARASPALKQTLLACCGMPEHAQLLIAVGRHHPEKRLGTLIAALARVRSRPVALVLLGDGPLRPWLQARAAQVRGAYVLGRVEDRAELAAMLASADALIHGSAAETFGLAVAEALCSGLPLIVPDRGGAAALARAEYAELYRAGDARACAAAIERLLARDPAALRAAAASSGRALVADSAGHFARLFALYQARLNARQTAPPAR